MLTAWRREYAGLSLMTSQETVGEQHALSMSMPSCALFLESIPVADVSLTMFANLGAPRTHQTYLSSPSKNCATPKRQRAYHALNPTLKLGTLLFEWPEITVATLNQSRSPTALLELRLLRSDVDQTYVDKCSSTQSGYAWWPTQVLALSGHLRLLAVVRLAIMLRLLRHNGRVISGERRRDSQFQLKFYAWFVMRRAPALQIKQERLHHRRDTTCQKIPTNVCVAFVAPRQYRQSPLSSEPVRAARYDTFVEKVMPAESDTRHFKTC